MKKVDAATIHELRKGNERAFNTVIDAYYKSIWLYFHKNTNRHEIADELSNDTFNRLWKYRRNLDAEQGVEAYLRRIAHSILQDWLKEMEKEKKQMAGYSQDRLKDDYEVGGEDALHARMDLTILVDKLGVVLPEKRCRIFVMSRILGMNYEEIAQELSISKATVRNQLIKAKKTMAALGGFGRFL
ncbi:RNA polymerase sigma-70 factor (ECF subfamily) [Sphingobacterium allocomposti]|uniref:RNA polymerase sigma-70 factor (ECF subfamily) n=1 Tax=Sphingobacterium allocomposti TaxID=415956 RepID=A0A5S5DCJ9_9SPHI|nr:sigma-70 family RNA polymerase sigma factor [Sphingobacterium composti Yoo et al. 2007 non Ten et al. 2007]TYP92422.1 RNA polymerase sigma-70 factor (ECF subfamily) [Sphingobacterium composti Yoo et al. 2007 non Ten et al. 2007]HLS95960.1 sigma-70 family RNA polymerase sigma factor [Sphingobacterium sp.]